jgi:hypothetical protein
LHLLFSWLLLYLKQTGDFYMPYQNTALHRRLSYWSSAFSVSILIIGSLVLTGWQFDLEFLKRPVPGLVAMNPLSAILFIACGISLFTASREDGKKERTVLPLLLSLLISLAAAIKLLSFFSGLEIPIDTTLFHTSVQQDIINNVPNRMAPNTAFCFLLAGIALALSKRAGQQVSLQLLALCILFFGLL